MPPVTTKKKRLELVDLEHALDSCSEEREIDDEFLEFAKFLGIDPVKEKDLLWIASKGLCLDLPPGFQQFFDKVSGKEYYYDLSTKTTSWSHPWDELLIEKVKKEREVQLKSKTQLKKKIQNPIQVKPQITNKPKGNLLKLPKASTTKMDVREETSGDEVLDLLDTFRGSLESPNEFENLRRDQEEELDSIKEKHKIYVRNLQNDQENEIRHLKEEKAKNLQKLKRDLKIELDEEIGKIEQTNKEKLIMLKAEKKNKLQMEQNVLDKEHKTLNLKKDNLNDELIELKSEKDLIVKTLESLQTQKINLDKQINDIESEKNILKLELNTLKSEKIVIEQQIEQSNIEKNEIVNEIKPLKNEKSLLLKQIADLESKKNEFTQKLAPYKEEANSIEEYLSNLKIEKNEVEEQLKPLKDEISELNRQISILKSEKKILFDQQNTQQLQLEKEMRSLESQELQIRNQQRSIEKKEHDLELKRMELRKEENEVNDLLIQIRREKNEHQDELYRLRSSFSHDIAEAHNSKINHKNEDNEMMALLNDFSNKISQQLNVQKDTLREHIHRLETSFTALETRQNVLSEVQAKSQLPQPQTQIPQNSKEYKTELDELRRYFDSSLATLGEKIMVKATEKDKQNVEPSYVSPIIPLEARKDKVISKEIDEDEARTSVEITFKRLIQETKAEALRISAAEDYLSEKRKEIQKHGDSLKKQRYEWQKRADLLNKTRISKNSHEYRELKQMKKDLENDTRKYNKKLEQIHWKKQYIQQRQKNLRVIAEYLDSKYTVLKQNFLDIGISDAVLNLETEMNVNGSDSDLEPFNIDESLFFPETPFDNEITNSINHQEVVTPLSGDISTFAKENATKNKKKSNKLAFSNKENKSSVLDHLEKSRMFYSDIPVLRTNFAEESKLAAFNRDLCDWISAKRSLQNKLKSSADFLRNCKF
eukprot:TRINITY_DN2071_c0_g1_i1.p1 TRINITY_DN2071_c0_g1~~TRINITY_DN2071_c0_g1_i1.p1  ORF type:complete len:936 (+),score=325.85 TRINITY_DN2071_c0_g1_i1:34-2841(+)